MLPFTPVRGTGVYLENAAGRRILDLYGGHAVAALGYGHRDLSETLARQSRELVFQTNALPLKIRDEAAEKLAAFGPPGLGRVFFVNSGAEANENALRLALKVTGRTKVVAMEHSFHGRTAAAGGRDVRRGEDVVRLSAHAVRRRVRAAQRRRRARRGRRLEHGGRHHRARAGLGRRIRLRAGVHARDPRGLRPRGRAADHRRGADGHGPARRTVRRAALRRAARSLDGRERLGRRLPVRRRADAAQHRGRPQSRRARHDVRRRARRVRGDQDRHRRHQPRQLARERARRQRRRYARRAASGPSRAFKAAASCSA